MGGKNEKKFVAFLLVVSLVLSVFAAAPVSAASSFKNVKSFKSGAKIDLYKGAVKKKRSNTAAISPATHEKAP